MKSKLTKLLFIIAIFGCFLFCAANDAQAGWTAGKYNSAIDFNGTTTYIDGFGAIGNVNTVSFWIKADDLSKSIIDLNSTQTITVSSGTILANNFTSPTIYVDGKISTTLPDTNWHHIVITTATNISASAVVIGKVSTNFFDGKLDEVRLYNYVRIADEIRLDYQAGYATHLGPSGKTCSQDPASCMDYGLVGSWGFDEGAGTMAYDSSDEGNDGTLTNSPKWTTDSPSKGSGRQGGSLKFDGVDDYITSNFQFSIFNFQSISNWINFQTLATGKPIIGKWGNSQNAILLKTDDTNSDEFKICVASGLTDDCANYGVTADANIVASAWYNIQIVYDGTQSANADKLKLYLNGAQKTLSFTGTIPSTLQNSTGALEIGGDSDLASYVNAKIDDVRIYNRALSAEEVRYHYNKGGPVAEWGFDEGSGTTAFDSSINRNNGVITPGSGGWIEGKYGGAYDFDGSATYMEATVAQTKTAYSLWVKNGSVWEHVVNNNGTYYVNGIAGATPASYPIYVSGNIVQIGKSDATTFVDCSIDDVRIYNYARTAEQIQMDYQQGVGTRF
ncbi:MAG: hypothetical protein P1P85_05015 [Patescibacteria group bacterium]|nr:hypothetical protein [Patescibacteria group bacterium]